MNQPPYVRVTNHAVERYRERVAPSLPVEAVRERIIRLLTPAASVKATRYALDGVTYCIAYQGDCAVITTVYTGTLPLSRTRTASMAEVSA